MRRIGLMGGTFDPIHNAHIALAKSAKKQYNLNEVIFMTGGNPPHKKESHITDAKIRFEMVCAAIDGIEGFSASDYEIKKTEYSYSVNTLKWLHRQCPDSEIYFIIGEDSLSYIDKWYEPYEIIKLCTILVYPRESLKTLKSMADEVSKTLGGDIRIINAPVYDISSTNIRGCVKNGYDISDMVSEEVYKIIKDRGLYGYR